MLRYNYNTHKIRDTKILHKQNNDGTNIKIIETLRLSMDIQACCI